MNSSTPFIPFGKPLLEARFIRREKRFLAHMELAEGSRVTAHCANTGSMRSHLEPGAPTLLWDSRNPKRKLPLSWKAIRIGDTWVGIDTLLPNRLVEEAIATGWLSELAGYPTIRRERRISPESRIDLLLEDGERRCYVEVKNVTLVEEGVARFPDAVTERGKKHLRELLGKVTEGHRAAMVYVVQRGDAKSFRPADDIDPAYGETLREALNVGVETYVIATRVSPEGVEAVGRLEVDWERRRKP